MKWFGRDPVMVLAVISAFVQAGLTYVPDGTLRAALTGLTVAVVGAIGSFFIQRQDAMAPAMAALVKAVVAVAVVVGLPVPEAFQVSLVAAMELAVGLWLRQQVSAKVAGSQV